MSGKRPGIGELSTFVRRHELQVNALDLASVLVSNGLIDGLTRESTGGLTGD